MKTICRHSILISMAIFASSCMGDGTTIQDSSGVLGESLLNSKAIVLNSLGESLSAVYDGSPVKVLNNLKDRDGRILNTGSAPNQIIVKGRRGYLLNSLSNNIQVIDLSELKTVDELSLGSNSSPYLMAFYGDDKLYVTCLYGDDGNGQVKVVDLPSEAGARMKVSAVIDMPKGDELNPFPSKNPSAKPQGVALSGGKIYVTLTNLDSWQPGGPGMVVVIDPESDTIVKKLQTEGLNASYAYVSPNMPDRVFILHSGTFTGDGVVSVIDSASDTVIDNLNIGGAPYCMTLTSDGKGFVTDALGPHLLKFDATTLAVLNSGADPIPIEGADKALFNFISYIDVDEAGLLFALAFNSDELYVIDPADSNISEGPFLLGDGPIAMALKK